MNQLCQTLATADNSIATCNTSGWIPYTLKAGEPSQKSDSSHVPSTFFSSGMLLSLTYVLTNRSSWTVLYEHWRFQDDITSHRPWLNLIWGFTTLPWQRITVSVIFIWCSTFDILAITLNIKNHLNFPILSVVLTQDYSITDSSLTYKLELQ